MLTFGIVLAVIVLILGVRYIDHLDKIGESAERDLEQKPSGDGADKFKTTARCKEQKYIQIK